MEADLFAVGGLLNPSNLKPLDDMASIEDETASLITNHADLQLLIDANSGPSEGNSINYHASTRASSSNKESESQSQSQSEPTIEESSLAEDNNIYATPITPATTPPPELKEHAKHSYHTNLIREIHRIQNDLHEIKVVPTFPVDCNKIKVDVKYAEEISHMLQDEFDENTVASGIREAILHFTRVVPFIFDGQRSVMGVTLANMRGYDRAVKCRINHIKSETILLARGGKKLFGGHAVSIFQLARTIGFPLITTYSNNKSIGIDYAT
jgi:hypothetical protein